MLLLDRLIRAVQQRLDCYRQRCAYYDHYLPKGPAHMSHEEYHVAVQKCVAAQTRCLDFHREHPLVQGERACCLIASVWERRVRV